MPFRRKPLTLLALAAVALARGGVAVAAPLTVCVDRTSPSAKIDERVARAAAMTQGQPIRIHYYNGTGDEDGLKPREFRELLGQDCELVVGFPQAAGAPDLPKGVNATRAYAAAGFVLVTAKPSVTKLADLPASTTLAVTFNTTPNVYFLDHPNLVRKIHETDAESLDAVAKGEVAGAMLWQPSAVREIERNRRFASFVLGTLDEPNARYTIVALYGERGEAAARGFETAIDALRNDGRLARTLGRYAEVAATTEPSGVRRTAARGRPQQGLCAAPAKGAKAPPALFTDAQAGQGAALYQINCSYCHAPDMTGRSAPGLKGKFFAAESLKHSVGDIFTIVSENMPATQPASLKKDEYAKIMAYILQQNGYPAGTTDLDYDALKKSKTPLRYYGP